MTYLIVSILTDVFCDEQTFFNKETLRYVMFNLRKLRFLLHSSLESPFIFLHSQLTTTVIHLIIDNGITDTVCVCLISVILLSPSSVSQHHPERRHLKLRLHLQRTRMPESGSRF